MRQRGENNLQELIKKIRTAKLYLGAYLHENKHPQLIITDMNPMENSGVEASCFFIFSFIIPTYSNLILDTPKGIVKLKIYPYPKKISGISDGMMYRISSEIDTNIEKLKK